jgi:hypothetical protein
MLFATRHEDELRVEHLHGKLIHLTFEVLC